MKTSESCPSCASLREAVEDTELHRVQAIADERRERRRADTAEAEARRLRAGLAQARANLNEAALASQSWAQRATAAEAALAQAREDVARVERRARAATEALQDTAAALAQAREEERLAKSLHERLWEELQEALRERDAALARLSGEQAHDSVSSRLLGERLSEDDEAPPEGSSDKPEGA